jgi:CRISPR-associated protein Cmr4
VATGALFTEEYLPSESILYSIVLASPEFKEEKDRKLGNEKDVMGFFETNLPSIIQLGGNATLGKGILRTKLA